MRQLLTVSEVCKVLGATERTVRRYIANGELKVERYGKPNKKTGRPHNVRVPEIELEIFVRSRP